MAKFATTHACMVSLIAELKASSTLQTTIAGLYHKALTFHIGYDERQLPPVETAPYLVVMPANYGRNSDNSGQTHNLQLALITPVGTFREVSGVTVCEGFEDAETAARAIDTALADWIYENFCDGQTKQPFTPTISAPVAVKTVWGYEFQDQM